MFRNKRLSDHSGGRIERASTALQKFSSSESFFNAIRPHIWYYLPMTKQRPNLLNKQIALPSDHGSWVFLLSPLLIGLFAGGRWDQAHAWLILTLMAVFLLRQPAAMLVKTLSGRRSKRDMPAALTWIGVYGLLAVIGLVQLIRLRHAYLLWLALPGLAVFGWHLWLVSRREERRQMGVDIIASGTLALAAPAAYWVAVGGTASTGWWLWALTWLQSAASIVYAFLRLEQRSLKFEPTSAEKWRMGTRALLYSGFNLAAVLTAGLFGLLPAWLWLAYLLQFAEVVWGTLNPAVGVRPTAIGLRQLAVSTLFTILFILLW